MDGELSLQNVLDGSEAATEEVVEVEETKGAEVEAETPEPEPAKAEDETPASEDEEKESPTVPVAALTAERRKRQELERRLEALEAAGKQETAKPDELPDVFADQDGFARALETKFASQLQNVRIETAQQIMRQMHDDYDEREAKFLEYVQENPAVTSDPKFKENPALFAYEFARKLDEYAEVTNLDAWKEKERAKLRAEILAETEKERENAAATAAKRSDAEMPSLASSGSAGPGAEAESSLSELTRLG